MIPSDLIQYRQIILKRLWLIVLLVVSTLTTVAAVSLARPRLYQTTLRFQITALPPSDVSLYQAARSGGYREEIAATQANFIEVLTSLEVAWDTVNALQLPISGRELAQKISIQESNTSDFVKLTVRAENPQQAADIANTLIGVAMKRYGELNARPLTVAQEFIASQIDETQRELNDARAELIAFQAANKLGTLNGAVDAQVSLIRSLQLAHDEALSRGDDQQAQEYMTLIDQRQRELAGLIQLSSQYGSLDTRVGQLQSTYDFLLEKMTEAQLKENQARNLDFVQVLGQARVPDQAEPRISLPILLLSAVMATLLGVVLAFAWEYVERRRIGEAPAREPVARPYSS